ncbi:MAG: TlpA family protein disulfide reductase [Actinobacteria bacterium]|nr:TlpA family protein disulfide reductase [Actinomycetota bacterium]MCA1721649.1 TlpA family protein disulfide reductase [Actinomycetota bacterium]
MSQAQRSGARSRGKARAKKRSPGVVVAVTLAVVAATVAAVVTSTGRSHGGDLTVAYDRGTQVLDFRGESFAGKPLDTAALRGKPVVLNFYASWCTVCDRELPDFQRVSERLAGRVQFVGANPQSNDTTAASQKMLKRSGVTYPTLPDPQDELLRQFNTTGGLPTTVFIDGNGVVRKVHNGLLTEQLLLDEIAALGVQA